MIFLLIDYFIVPSLLTKLKRSQIGLDSTLPAFEQLTESCLQRKLPVESWKSAERLAMEDRGEALSIFDINHEKAPTLAQITLRLADENQDSSDASNVVDWVADGIKAQNDQLVKGISHPYSLLTHPRSRLRYEIRKLPQKLTVNQQLRIVRLRTLLGRQVNKFLQSSSKFLPDIKDEDLRPLEDEDINTPAEESVEAEDLIDNSLNEEIPFEDEDDTEAASILPETVILPLPSNITSLKVKRSIESITLIERELRIGQANDSLEGIRIGLANKSLLLLTDVNQSKSTKQSTRAWASVRNTQTQILFHARGYQRAWKALKFIGTPEDQIIYQKLEEKDLVVVKDVTMAKRFGQGSDRLAWFWRIGPSQDKLTGEWMEECEQVLCFNCLS